MKLTVTHLKQVNRTRAIPVLATAWDELLKLGHADPVMIINWDDEALIAEDAAGHCLGVLSFTHMKWDRSIFVKIGYVRPSARRRGVYRRLWKRLVKIARERDVAQIQGATALQNTNMQRVMAHLGRRGRSINYVFDIGP